MRRGCYYSLYSYCEICGGNQQQQHGSRLFLNSKNQRKVCYKINKFCSVLLFLLLLWNHPAWLRSIDSFVLMNNGHRQNQLKSLRSFPLHTSVSSSLHMSLSSSSSLSCYNTNHKIARFCRGGSAAEDDRYNYKNNRYQSGFHQKPSRSSSHRSVQPISKLYSNDSDNDSFTGDNDSGQSSKVLPSSNNSNNNNNKNEDNINNKGDDINYERIAQQLQLFIQIAKPYFMESMTARYLLMGVILLTMANSGISVAFSYVGKDFWNALSIKDTTQFYNVLMKYVVALSIGAPIVTMYTYQREQLAIHWREWMTTRTFELYRNNQVYYKLERNRLNIDNPDQRITEDVNSFTSFSLSLLITLLTSIIDLASFSTILWNIYPQLFIAIILYAGSGTIINIIRENIDWIEFSATPQ